MPIICRLKRSSISLTKARSYQPERLPLLVAGHITLLSSIDGSKRKKTSCLSSLCAPAQTIVLDDCIAVHSAQDDLEAKLKQVKANG